MEQPGAAAGVEDCGAVRGAPQAAEDNIEDRIRLLLRCSRPASCSASPPCSEGPGFKFRLTG